VLSREGCRATERLRGIDALDENGRSLTGTRMAEASALLRALACVEAEQDKGRAERRGRLRACGGDEGQRAPKSLAEVHAACRVGEEAAVLTSGTELRMYVAAGAARRRAEGEVGLEGDGKARSRGQARDGEL
jgi:hypothetical protein